MLRTFSNLARVEFAPPKYLSLPTAGIDVSASGIKVVTFKETLHGVEFADFAEERLAPGTIQNSEVADRAAIISTLKGIAQRFGIRYANVTLPESRGYLFEASVPGDSMREWRTAVERKLDEYVPLPSTEVAFDIVPLAKQGTNTLVVGIGYARRVVESTLQNFRDAGITVRAIESEIFALPRALLPHHNEETVLIIDIGKTTTKLLVVSHRLPRFATTLDIGGHALTLAVQKHFGVTEEEAKRVKAERGLVVGAENEEYLAAMLSTVAVIREEIVRRLDYWQTRASSVGAYAPVTRAILVGGNATVRGLPEYLGSALKIPVELGDVFKNMASRNDWLPPLDYTESLAYGTAIGLTLREYVP
ncbi:MAG: Type pilus assembly protein PilM [Parcubacteria group bacterium]|nr:Type pilus assembly protein PilM [Parcubacteria group bacterium]